MNTIVQDAKSGATVAQCNSVTVAAFISVAPDMARMLRDLEWSGAHETCPSCHGSKSHEQTCELLGVLQKAGIHTK